MALGTRIIVIAVASVIVTATTSLIVQRSVIRRQGIEMLRDTMRSTVLGAEDTRNSVSAMRNAGIFDDTKLLERSAKASSYRDTDLYRTVPVVAAWNSIAEVARQQGYDFRVPALDPRNPTNKPRKEDEPILRSMEEGRTREYFRVDEKANEVIYARSIVLTTDCLVCHGDPATSPTRDGKDMAGFRMEGWRNGDRHGMFLLRGKLDSVDATVRAGLLQMALWLIPLSVGIGIAVYVVISRLSNTLRQLTRSLGAGADDVTAAVDQISQAGHAIACGASEQTASLEETSAAGEEITALTRRNAENSNLARTEMEAVQRVVAEGHAALDDMKVSMADIQASSDKIARIIKVVDEIAFQTNILALNAAVEAARAGESGAGFAVVADQVRALAHRSAQAARETAPLIQESIATAHQGNKNWRMSPTSFAASRSAP